MIGKREYGDYQTPQTFANNICVFLKNKYRINPSVIIEPTCGVGAFLKASFVFNAQYIYGLEINPEYCKICTNNIKDSRIKIINADFFNFDIKSLISSQNVLVIGNPPWVTNSALSTIESENLPEKFNFKRFKGIDAITGSSNFDICEYIILKLVSVFCGSNTTIAMLCKTSVARNIFIEINRSKICCDYCDLYEIDAKKLFGISASACLLVIQLTNKEDTIQEECRVYDFNSPNTVKSRFGFKKSKFFSNLDNYSEDFDGICCFEWRQGVKHDCSKIMELSLKNGLLINGRKEFVDIEKNIVFPLIKSSMFKQPIINKFSKFVIVTQRKAREETNTLKNKVPRTWAYLNKNRALFDNRKSSIYQGAPAFSMFGVGDYSYSKYKVGISGFYKEPLFSVLFSDDGKPVMTDDTSYFICFDNYDAAYVAMLYLNSYRVKNFLKKISFQDAKRPYTKKVLSRINFRKIISTITMNELKETEKELNLNNYITTDMINNFSTLFLFSKSLTDITV